MTQSIITIDSPVWLVAGASMKNFLAPENTNRMSEISTYPFNPKSPPTGYTLIGDAHISITLHDSKEITKNKIEALNKEKTRVMAKAEAEMTRIEKQIQSLLAIEMN
jgi:hypothetical protein